MSLPLFYEIGRCAAFSAADAHREMPEVNITTTALMAAAYNVVIETDAADAQLYTDCPDELTPASPHWAEFAEGYRDALAELASPDDARRRFAAFERLGERLSARPDEQE